MSDNKLNVALIGAGYIGRVHAFAWNSVKQVFGTPIDPFLHTLVEANGILAQNKALELGFANSSSDWHTVIDNPDIRAVSICVPNDKHFDIALAAIQKGKHVWLEKPMTPSYEQSKKLVAAHEEASARRGLKGRVIVGYNYIQNPMIREMKKIIQSGEIGVIREMRLEMDEDFMAVSDSQYSPRNGIETGWGAVDDFGVHVISLIHNLMDTNIQTVVSQFKKSFYVKYDSDGVARPITNFDLTSFLFTMKNDTDTIHGSVNLNRAAHGRKGRIGIQVYGTEGSVLYDQERMNELQVYHSGDKGFQTILAGPNNYPYDRFIPAPGHSIGFTDLKTIECHEFIDYLTRNTIQNKHPLVVDLYDALAIEKVVDAVIESNEIRNWVDV